MLIPIFQGLAQDSLCKHGFATAGLALDPQYAGGLFAPFLEGLVTPDPVVRVALGIGYFIPSGM